MKKLRRFRWFHQGKSKWIETPGYEVVIPGFEDCGFFVFCQKKYEYWPAHWSVTDPITGHSIGKGQTKEGAITAAKEELKCWGRKHFLRVRKRMRH